MERTQRLYDCITDIGDRYLQEAEEFRPVIRPQWRRWASLAAALILVVGLGRWAADNLMWYGGSNSTSTTASSAGSTAGWQPDSTSGAATTEEAPGEAEVSGEGVDGLSEYEALARAADVIVEGTITDITAVLDDGASQEESYIIAELKITDMLKGDGEQGETIQIRSLCQEDEPDWVQIGTTAIYFLSIPTEGDENAAFELMDPSLGCVVVDGDTVLAGGELLDQDGGTVPMDKAEFKALILRAVGVD